MDFLALAMVSNNLMLLLAWILFQLALADSANENESFTFNGFRSAKLDLDGVTEFTPNGLLRLTNMSDGVIGHAFYPDPIPFTNSSFSTTFVFGIVPKHSKLGGYGIAFVVASDKSIFKWAYARECLGLFNRTNSGDPRNRMLAIELDMVLNAEYEDINDNHVGIDINSLVSNLSAPAGYYVDSGKTTKFENLTLVSGRAMQLWVDYDGNGKRIEVTLAPFKATRPSIPLLSMSLDLSRILGETVYVGFSASTGTVLSSDQYILGWSFQMNRHAEALDLSKLPKLPRKAKNPTKRIMISDKLSL